MKNRKKILIVVGIVIAVCIVIGLIVKFTHQSLEVPDIEVEVTETPTPELSVTAVPTDIPVSDVTPTPTNTEGVGYVFEETGIRIYDVDLGEIFIRYGDLTDDDIEDLLGFGISEEELLDRGVTIPEEPAPIPMYTPEETLTYTDEDGIEHEYLVVNPDDYYGIYTDADGNRARYNDFGIDADEPIEMVDEYGNPVEIVTFFDAAFYEVTHGNVYNDYDTNIPGGTRKQMEEALVEHGYSPAEISYAMQFYPHDAKEEVEMLVDYIQHYGTVSMDGLHNYVVERGGDPQYIDYENYDEDLALSNLITNLIHDLPTLTMDDVKEICKMDGYKDMNRVEELFIQIKGD